MSCLAPGRNRRQPARWVAGQFETCQKRAALELSAVEGNGNDAWAIRVPVVAVGAGGMTKEKAYALQSPNDICRGGRRQATHAPERLTRIRSVMGSPRSIGIASPCFLRLSRYPRMASSAIARASSRVSPSVTSPGRGRDRDHVAAFLGRLVHHGVAVLGVCQCVPPVKRIPLGSS